MNYELRETEPDGSLMVRVPSGWFTMGLPESDFLAERHEQPQRRVHLSVFWIDVYPVTNARYALFLAAGGYEARENWGKEGWEWKCRAGIHQPLQWGLPGWDGPEQPVAGVSWYEADAYARWARRRLPTDAEWEKAARGTDGRRYPWGNDWPTAAVANFDMVHGRTTPVGLFPEGVSPYGCHDMAGNVNNWTKDWYWETFGDVCAGYDPQLYDWMVFQPGDGRRPVITDKVDRGGGYATPRQFQEVLGCTRKTHWTPETRHPWNGFRTAQSAEQPPPSL